MFNPILTSEAWTNRKTGKEKGFIGNNLLKEGVVQAFSKEDSHQNRGFIDYIII